MVKRRGDRKLMPVTPELAASLAPLAKLCGADLAAVATAAASLSILLQKQLPNSGPGMVAYLRGLGLEQP